MKKLLVSGAVALSLLFSPITATVAEPKSKGEQVNIIKDGMYDNHNAFVDESEYSLEKVLESVETVTHVVKYMISYETLDGKVEAYDFDASTFGTAVVIDKKDGYAYLLTNYHVANAKQPEIKIDKPAKWLRVEKVMDEIYIQKYYPGLQHVVGYNIHAEKVAGSEYLDAALIRAEDSQDFKKFPYEIGDSDDLRKGDFVWIVGNPLGLIGYVLEGNVSSLTYYDRTGWFMLGCDVQPGYSGGPVIAIRDGKYELVGLVNAVMVRENPPDMLPDTLGSYGIAVKINPIMKMVEDYFNKLELEKAVSHQ